MKEMGRRDQEQPREPGPSSLCTPIDLWSNGSGAWSRSTRPEGPRLTGSSRPAFGLGFALLALAVSAKAEVDTMDYRDHLNPAFTKRPRQDTRFILIHSTECGLRSALRTLSRGKVGQGGKTTLGGHAHYLVARRGTVYRILDPRYRADHAGRSMWNGVGDLSNHSLGIELEGFHDVPFTASQYRSLAWLLKVLRKRFGIASRDVLEHYRVAYTPPNRFFSRNWRGRKRDPGFGNFDRHRAGLGDAYAVDPDVVAGRIGMSPPRLHGRREIARGAARPRPRREPAGMLTRGRTAWSIAGTRYRDADTLYVLPGGAVRRGSEVRNWSRLPRRTRVFVGAAPP